MNQSKIEKEKGRKGEKVIGTVLLLCSFSPLLLFNVAAAAEGYVSKTATGTTSAVVHFPAGKTGLQIVGCDATSDKAGSAISFRIGSVPTFVAIAAANGSNVTTYASALASNDVVLLQNAAEVVTNATVWGRTAVTNKLVTLRNVTGTNLAIGDTVKARLSTAYPLLAASASGDTTFFLPNLATLAADDIMLLDRGIGFALAKATVTAVATNSARYLVLTTPAPEAVPMDAAIYAQTSNTTAAAASVAATNKITVTSTNGMDIQTMLVLDTFNGPIVRQITNFVSATVIELDRNLGAPLGLSNYVWMVNATVRSNLFPVLPGELRMYVTAGAGTLTTIIVVPTNQFSWRTATTGTASSNLFTLTTAAAFDVAASAGHNLYKLTNTYTAILAAAAADYSVTLNNATNLSAGDAVVVIPASGGVFANVYDSSAAQIFNTVTFTTGVGAALSAGDRIYSTIAAGSSPVGVATCHLFGQALFVAPQYAPAQLSIDGTSACSINVGTANYGR